MSLRINQNVLAIGTYSSVAQTSSRLEKSIQKLSSGLRINGASDDAAGLAISEKMRRQIRGLSRAVLNAQDGISMIQTAEGALNESQSILHRMRELAIQSSNDTLTSNDRLEIQKEVVQLKDDLNRIARNTEFNTKKLLDGSQTALISASSSSVKGIVSGAINNAGGDYDVDISLLRGGIAEMQRSQIFTLNDGTGSLASGGTQLQSIAQFYDANGVFVLDTPQSLTMSGNGKTTTINLDGQMTLDNLSAEIQNAMGSKSGLGIDNSRTATVNTIQTRVAGLGGYIQIVSGSIGGSGRVSLSSDQKVIDSLGFSISREAVENRVEVALRDNFGNVRKVKTEGNVASSILDGIDVKFTSQAAQIAGTQGLEAGINITAVASTFVISAGQSQVTITVGSGLWSMEGLARSINSAIDGVGIDGLSAAVVEGELRLSYERPASVSATVANTVTIANVISQAATLGFLAGTYSGFVDGRKDDSVVRWGFSRFMATAAGDITLSVSDGINGEDLVISLVTTATTADMVDFITFQASANSLFAAGSVAVRLDQVGGALAFTSTRVGKENLDNAAANTSMVSLSITGAAADEIFINSSLGLSDGTVKGAGDKNFKLHVVDNEPQFQIGADQGQTMKISIANMSAEALGVEDIDLTTVARASEAIGKLNKAIDIVSSERSKLGAYQNRLEYAVNNLRNTHSNLSASESRIRDADIAMEMIEFTRNQIISQSGTAMLAQANAVPQGVLQLLG